MLLNSVLGKSFNNYSAYFGIVSTMSKYILCIFYSVQHSLCLVAVHSLVCSDYKGHNS